MKRCTRCKQVKPEDEFYPRRRNPDGSIATRRAKCAECEKALIKARPRKRTIDDNRGHLPAEPFRLWCQRRMEEDEVGPTIFASRIGLSDRRLADHLAGRSVNVPVQVVDRALIRDGGWHLAQVYPHLYPDATPEVIDLLQRAARCEAIDEWEKEQAA